MIKAYSNLKNKLFFSFKLRLSIASRAAKIIYKYFSIEIKKVFTLNCIC